jgi:nitroreductase
MSRAAEDLQSRGDDAAARTAALERRYGPGEPLSQAGPWNAQIEGLLAHRSVRGFLPDALPDGTLETLVAAAQSAATSSNLQSWSVIAVEDPAARAELARIAAGQRHVRECPLFLVFLADLSRNRRLGARAGQQMAALDHLESFLVAAIDAALAAQNTVVAAESLGLSTVYIGALRNDPEAVARQLGLPAGCAAVFGLCVGRAAPGAAGAVKPRLPQRAVLFRDRYDAAAEAGLVASYDARLEEFSRRNESSPDGWTRRVLARLATLANFGGRERLGGALRALGFALR